jgi:hypothetical protein
MVSARWRFLSVFGLSPRTRPAKIEPEIPPPDPAPEAALPPVPPAPVAEPAMPAAAERVPEPLAGPAAPPAPDAAAEPALLHLPGQAEPLRVFRHAGAAELLAREEPVGSGDPVALIQHFLPEIGAPTEWRPGPRVRDLAPGSIPPGTVIATFWGDAFHRAGEPARGRHAAFYLGHDAKGIRVAEQWARTPPAEAVRKRGGGVIRFRTVTLPEDQAGPPPPMAHTGEYYSVVLDPR